VDGAVPYTLLHGTPPDYDQLRVFGCLCYPNLSATTSHKLAPRSTACVFLGYPSSHKGYRCLDLATKRIIISRHVVFDETLFPFSAVSSSTSDLDFLSAPNPAATRVAAPSLRDVERPRPSPLLHEDDDPAILVRGPLLQALPLEQVTASPPPAPAPVPPAPLPADPRAIIRVYSRRPRPHRHSRRLCHPRTWRPLYSRRLCKSWRPLTTLLRHLHRLLLLHHRLRQALLHHRLCRAGP
jgi:hypothetical protein